MVDSGGDRTTSARDALTRLTRERRSGTNAYDLTYTYDAADEQTVANAGGTRTIREPIEPCADQW